MRLTLEELRVAREVAELLGVGERYVRQVVHRRLGHKDRRNEEWISVAVRDRALEYERRMEAGESAVDIARALGIFRKGTNGREYARSDVILRDVKSLQKARAKAAGGIADSSSARLEPTMNSEAHSDLTVCARNTDNLNTGSLEGHTYA